jgi:hypothetical protein
MYCNFGREITKYTVIYGVFLRFWPTLMIMQMAVCPLDTSLDSLAPSPKIKQMCVWLRFRTTARMEMKSHDLDKADVGVAFLYTRQTNCIRVSK